MADQASLPNLQAYGLYIAPGNGDRIIVANNNLTGNATGGALIGATGQAVYVTDNIGYRTVSSGTASVAAGKTSITLRQGLDAPVAAISIQVTPTGDWGERRSWVTTTRSGDFTVSATSPATVALPFRWRASAFGN